MEIFYSKSKLVKAFLLSLLAVFSISFVIGKAVNDLFIQERSLLTSVSRNDLFWGVAGTAAVFGIVIFGGVGVSFLLKLFRSEPPVIISLEGIEDRRLNTGMIEWNEIAFVIFNKDSHSQFLSVTLHSPEKYHQRLPKFERFLRKINNQKGSDSFYIYFNDLDQPIEEAWEFIENNVTKPREEKSLALLP